ncbi:MAG TPA: FGGY-family carbohydrate kinase, partial [Aurantimonas sp.]|nr:FGGY-family carbohydrate kinase [Aurantimonas sp.]
GTPVGAPVIDAHSGGIGTLGGRRPDGSAAEPSAELALIMGTSSCAMAVTREAVFVDGVWGPYKDSLLPGYWLLEGGQSAYGAALDYLVALHPAYPQAKADAASDGRSVLDHLESRAIQMAGSVEEVAGLAAKLDIVPEFLGNRSPEADPDATAVIAGLSLDTSEASLVRLFVAGLCGLSYGTGQIVEAMRARGVGLGTIVVAGGAARSPLLRRILADATGLKVALPQTAEPVLLGGAIVGAVAGGVFADLRQAAAAMCRIGEEIEPNPALAAFHAGKCRAYEILQRAEREIRATRSTASFKAPTP